MLLIIEALLLILAALGQDHRAAVEGQIFPLDMAENSVDDQYDGCRENMADLVKEYLNKELSDSVTNTFKQTWEDGKEIIITPKDNLTTDHLIAIYVYTSNEVYREFNNAVRNGKQNYIDKTFMWHSLHFLLTEAIQILNEKQNACRYTTFRSTNVRFNQDVLNTEVRFGSFASSSLERYQTETFGNKSCFEIVTCYGADLTEYSRFDNEREVLIPPYETFNVTDVTVITDQPDLRCDTVYTLVSTGTKSDLNCALLNKPTSNLRKRLQLLKEYICTLFSRMTMCKCCG